MPQRPCARKQSESCESFCHGAYLSLLVTQKSVTHFGPVSGRNSCIVSQKDVRENRLVQLTTEHWPVVLCVCFLSLFLHTAACTENGALNEKLWYCSPWLDEDKLFEETYRWTINLSSVWLSFKWLIAQSVLMQKARKICACWMFDSSGPVANECLLCQFSHLCANVPLCHGESGHAKIW